MDNELFNKIEEKTKVNKETIISLAKKLQDGNFKDKTVLKDIISEISTLTGKDVSKDKEDRIIDMIINDKVPKNVDKYV
ncbi:MAG: stage VI sporulation protein F [Bacilli bacterium]